MNVAGLCRGQGSGLHPASEAYYSEILNTYSSLSEQSGGGVKVKALLSSGRGERPCHLSPIHGFLTTDPSPVPRRTKFKNNRTIARHNGHSHHSFLFSGVQGEAKKEIAED